MTLKLHDIYFIKDSECSDIVNDYRIHRGCFNNTNMDEGLVKLYKASVDALENLKKDIYYEERLLVEAMTFLQYLLCFQRKPINEWREYYRKMLKLFHSHKQLLFKTEVSTLKNFIKKEDCCIVSMFDDDIRLHYKTARELQEDFGRYRSDLIVKEVKQNGKNIDFAWILGLLL